MSEPVVVDAQDPAKKNSQVLNCSIDEMTVQMDQQNKSCYWNDQEFAPGDTISVDGECYECSFSRWVKS